MGGCVSNHSRSISESMPVKKGTIGHDECNEDDDFSRSTPNVPTSPITSNYDSQLGANSNNINFIFSNLEQMEANIHNDTYKERKITQNSTIIRKHRRTLTNPIISGHTKNISVSEISVIDWIDPSIHNQSKINRYCRKQIDYASGQFAHVFVTNLSDNFDENETKQRKVAIKKIDVGDWISKTTKKNAEKELKILQTLNNHQNVVKLIDSFYEICYNDLYLHLVMEFIPSTLYKEITKYGALGECIPFKLIQIYSYQILRGINYINYIQNVIHRDLKPENILINPLTNCVKICDFGCSKQINNDKTLSILNFYVCSRYYRAPELLVESTHYEYPIDIWSIGCILSELFLGNILFDGIDQKDQIKEIIKTLGLPTKNDLIAMNNYYQYDKLLDEFGDINIYNNYTPNWRFVFIGVQNMPQIAIDLISKILKYDPKQRLHPFHAMQHEYFMDLKDDKDNNQYPIPSGMFDLNDEEIKFAKQLK